MRAESRAFYVEVSLCGGIPFCIKRNGTNDLHRSCLSEGDMFLHSEFGNKGTLDGLGVE